MVEPCLLAREIEVALDIEAVSFICKYVKVKNRGKPSLISSVGSCLHFSGLTSLGQLMSSR